MDISPEYILQCEKAEEIQKSWRPMEWDFYQWTPSESWEEPYIWAVLPEGIADSGVYGSIFVSDKGEATCDGKNKSIWLPRQDQLQEMVKDNLFLKKLFFHWRGDGLIGMVYAVGNEIISATSSMEQLWLAFVMSEKYGKIWNGNEWETKEIYRCE